MCPFTARSPVAIGLAIGHMPQFLIKLLNNIVLTSTTLQHLMISNLIGSFLFRDGGRVKCSPENLQKRVLFYCHVFFFLLKDKKMNLLSPCYPKCNIYTSSLSLTSHSTLSHPYQQLRQPTQHTFCMMSVEVTWSSRQSPWLHTWHSEEGGWSVGTELGRASHTGALCRTGTRALAGKKDSEVSQKMCCWMCIYHW